MPKLARAEAEVIDEICFGNLESAEDTLRGMKESAERGFYNGDYPPLGYQRVGFDVMGVEKSRLPPAEPEAQVVMTLAGEKGSELIRRIKKSLPSVR